MNCFFTLHLVAPDPAKTDDESGKNIFSIGCATPTFHTPQLIIRSLLLIFRHIHFCCVIYIYKLNYSETECLCL